MSPRDRIAFGVRELLEQQYLKSVGAQARDEYLALHDEDKRATLKDFLQKQTGGSEEQWAKALQDLL